MGFFFRCCCQYCLHKCLTLTFTGWGGPPSNCLCEDLDGEYILQRSECGECVYTWCGIKACSDGVNNIEICLSMTLEITATNRILTVSTSDTTEPNFTGTIAESGNPCGDMEFLPGDITGITSPGTVTVTTATCPSGSQQPCCTDCCDSFPTVEGVENDVQPACCAYLVYLPGDDGSGTFQGFPIPVGASGDWPPGPGDDMGPFSQLGSAPVTSVCGRAYYLDYIAAGSPACHDHVTTAKRSIVMEWNGIPVEVFLNDNCCPESIQVGAPGDPADWDLRFGPVTFPQFFYDFNTSTHHPLYICEEVARGACCVDDTLLGTGRTEFVCEAVGDGVLEPGTWYQDGTYDPGDPCNPLP